jgi:hypothetical protein
MIQSTVVKNVVQDIDPKIARTVPDAPIAAAGDFEADRNCKDDSYTDMSAKRERRP